MKTTSIKFYYNGLRLNGSRALVKCSYSIDNSRRTASPCVTICADRGGSLPRDLFPVENDTDIMTDYFDNDRATITADHPLYPFARAAAVKYEINLLKISQRYAEKRAAGGYMADYYAKEAARAVRDWAFQNTDYDILYSYMKYTNIGSYSTALANGMKKVKEYANFRNILSYAYAITREEWEALAKA